MYVKHSLSVACNNLRVMLRAVVVQLVVVALVLAIVIALFGDIFADVLTFIDNIGFSNFIVQTVNSIGNGTFNVDEFTANFESVANAILEGLGGFSRLSNVAIISYLVAFGFVFLYRVLVSLPDVATVYQISEFMTSNARRPFFWCFSKKMVNALVFSLTQFAVTAPLDLALIFITVGTYVLLLPAFKYALVFALVVFVCLYAMRTAFFAFWLPVYTEGEGTVSVREALHLAVSKGVYVFSRLFAHTLLAILIALVFDALAILFIPLQSVALAVALLVSLVCFYYLKCLSLVAYYGCENRQYFVNFVEIEGTESYIKKQQRQLKRASKKE